MTCYGVHCAHNPGPSTIVGELWPEDGVTADTTDYS